MPTTTARARIASAFEILGVFQPGQSVPADDATAAFGAWSLAPLMAPCIAREVFALTADKGGPSDPYTIGPGGDFNTTKPAANALTGAGLLLGTSDPVVEVPIPIITDDMFQWTSIKELSNAQFTTLYYRATYQDGLGTIILWPVPDTAENSLALYRLTQLTSFLSLTAQYDVPEGYEEAIDYNLAIRLAAPYGRPVTPDISALAVTSLAAVKRANTKPGDVPIDPMFAGSPNGGYIIQSGGNQWNR
jgi:hypothetical protein